MEFINIMKFYRFAALIIIFTSCATKKSIHYFQDSETYEPQEISYQDPTIQPNDVLNIQVSALELEVAAPYNFQVPNNGQNNNNQGSEGYVVNSSYHINFPILGIINVKGLTTEQLEKKITAILIDDNHINDPAVRVRLMNAKFTVLGSVARPGTINYTDQNLNIVQAIGLAGDLSINGVREDILLIREIDKVRRVTHLDLTSMDLTSNPYYYIKPNDIIYVKQNGPEVKRAGYIPSLTALLGFATFTFGIIALLTAN